MEGAFYTLNRSEKRRYFQMYFSLYILPELSENNCIICFVPLTSTMLFDEIRRVFARYKLLVPLVELSLSLFYTQKKK